MATAELITSNRMTRPNHGPNKTYRLPLNKAGTIQFKSGGDRLAVYGDAIDKLGRIEDMFTMKEIEELYRRKMAGQL